MKIYAAEKNIAGLAEQIVAEASCRASITLPIKIESNKDEALAADLRTMDRSKVSTKVNTLIDKAVAELDPDQHPDLLYGSAILVSTLMNLNDDVFLPEQVWAARSTPPNTPFNDQHEAEDIIGHIYASQAVNEELEVIADDTAVADLPEFFHLTVDFVVYAFFVSRKSRRDKSRSK